MPSDDGWPPWSKSGLHPAGAGLLCSGICDPGRGPGGRDGERAGEGRLVWWAGWGGAGAGLDQAGGGGRAPTTPRFAQLGGWAGIRASGWGWGWTQGGPGDHGGSDCARIGDSPGKSRRPPRHPIKLHVTSNDGSPGSGGI